MENTEKKILESAKKVFQTKGYAAARMQEIADDAGINKAALHYYFRSKEKLFKKVFEETFASAFPKIGESFLKEENIFNQLERFISLYIDFLHENIKLLGFIICEIHTNSKIISEVLERTKTRFSPEIFAKSIQKAQEDGLIRPINPKHLFVNIISLCVFPFLSKAVYSKVYKMSPQELELFLSQRKSEVFQFVKYSLKKD